MSKYMSICKWCLKEFDTKDKPRGWMANHSRWCEENPKKDEYKKSLKLRNNIDIMNEARKKSGRFNQFSAARLDDREIPVSILKGKVGQFLGKNHSEETKKILKEKALNSDHRRLKKKTIIYNGVILDSSWELALAKRLDSLNIKWIRPKPIKWSDDSNTEHNYFPDFYLIDFDLFLDPKNKQAYKVQKYKIDILKKTYKNIIFLKTLKECEEFNAPMV